MCVVGLSQRRAMRLLGVDRSAVRYRKKRKDDAADRELLRALAAERRRFGVSNSEQIVVSTNDSVLGTLPPFSW